MLSYTCNMTVTQTITLLRNLNHLLTMLCTFLKNAVFFALGISVSSKAFCIHSLICSTNSSFSLCTSPMLFNISVILANSCPRISALPCRRRPKNSCLTFFYLNHTCANIPHYLSSLPPLPSHAQPL